MSKIVKMLTRVLVLVLVGLIGSAVTERWTLIQDERGHEELVDLDMEKQLPEPRLKENEVLFYYASHLHQEPVQVRLGEAVSDLKATDFNPKRTTYFIVHGWHNDNTSSLNHLVGTAILSKGEDYNLIVTDWSKAASGLYLVARTAVPVVGGAITSLINELGLDTGRLTIIGHSLGAHASGIAGATLSATLGLPAKIVGLDPALPLFELTELDGRLDPTDASLIHIIHTCAGFLGFLDPLGHADYYPGQGGTAQPGCSPDPFCVCAHGRSYQYYAESIQHGGFTATSCDNYDHYLNGTCDGNPRSKMGGLLLDGKAKGTYYLHVNNHEPFSLG